MVRLRTGQELAVVGVEVGVHLVGLLGGVDLAGAGAVVLVEVAVHVDTATLDRIIEFAKVFQRLGGDRQREPGHDRHVQQGRFGVSGVGAVPLVDLLADEPDRILLRGEQRLCGLAADGLDTSTADHPQPAPLRLGEQRVLGVRERRTEDHGGGGARGDAAATELLGGLLSEFGIGETGFRREDAQVEPLE
jgi:hypothetical protein